MPDEITHQSFEALIGETIDLKSGEDHFRAKVESVNLLRKDSSQQRQPFSVDLLADGAVNHGQNMYELSHPDLGALNLFMVPLGPSAQGMRYEIVFN